MALLPRFVVLKSIYNNKYLRYVHEDGPAQGFLQFAEEQVSSPYVKFEIEMAKSSGSSSSSGMGGLVHIRCCYNNKYWVRWSPNHWWIVAGADKPEEDRSQWSCTLFEPVFIHGDIHPTIKDVGPKIRFRHVQLGHYACLWLISGIRGSCLHGGSSEPDQNWCDILSLVDWESLSISPLTKPPFTTKMPLPRYVVLKSNYNNKYLRCIQEEEEDGPVHGYLQFSEEEVSSSYAKLEVKPAETIREKGCVHLRCCYSNKYLARGSPDDWWIVARADEPEEDRSKWSCTLFEPLYADDNAKIGRLRHVQLGHYACLWRASPPHDSCLFAGSRQPDKDGCDIYTFVDWKSLQILPVLKDADSDAFFTRDEEKMQMPRFFVLKSNYNDKYLRYLHEDGEVHGLLQFSGEEVSSPYCKYEVLRTTANYSSGATTSGKGSVLAHIRCCYNNKYLVRWSPSHWWIAAQADEPEEDISKWSCTLFEFQPIYVDDGGAAKTTIGSIAQIIRFRHVQLGHYACLWRVGPPYDSCLYAGIGGSAEPSEEQVDVYTIIDWESLSLLQPKDEALITRPVTVELPRFVVVKSNYNDKYLRYIHEDGQVHMFLQFSGEEIVNPYTKYEVMKAESSTSRRRGELLGHLRCCYNNKYLARWSPKHSWIVAGADEPEEDQSKWSCTLFEFLYVDAVAQTIRFRHVQLGTYACLSRAAPPHDSCLYAGSSTQDRHLCDVFTIIDLNRRLILPKHVAFKGDNGKYLSASLIKGKPYLRFSSTDIDSTVGNEVITTSDGSVHIKSHHSGKFWRRNDKWIWADSDGATSAASASSNNSHELACLCCFFDKRRKPKKNQQEENKSSEFDLLFWPIKVDTNVVAFQNLGNKKFCKRQTGTGDGKTSNCLSADDASNFSRQVRLEVEEFVTSRKIYDVNFRLKDSRIYNKSVLTKATEDAINRTQEPNTVDVLLSYTESRTHTWNSSVSLKLGHVKTTIQTPVPLIIAEGKIETLGENFMGDYRWGDTRSLTSAVEKVHTVTVPPMTMVRVSLLVKKASCDIPFSYCQLSTLPNGQEVTEIMDDGIYTGNNCFSFNYETKQEQL